MKRLYLPILSGILYALAFPKYGLWPVAWISIVPLLFSIEYRKPGRAFLQGFAAGLVAWGGVVYWIAYVMDTYGGMDLLTASFLLLLLMALLALYFGAFAWTASYFLMKRSAFFVLPGIWILLEMFRGTVVFSGFPWALLGHSQLPWSSLVQVAEIGGVHLISGIVLMGNIAVFKAARKDFVPAAVTALAIIVCVAFGQWRIGHDIYHEMPIRAAVAQANVAQDQKWLEESVNATIDTYAGLTHQALSQGAELVVWPETACPFFLFRKWPETYKVLSLSEGNRASLLTGSPAFENGRYYNRAWLLRGGKIMGYYDKVHLVPFGEYLPLASLLKPWFGSLTREVSDFSNGNRPTPIEDFGVMICFESIFPDVSRDLCLQGAMLLVNTSNDAWFSTWATPEQLLQITGFRAIETRRWIVRSVNHGISAMINPYGRTVERIGLLKVGMMVRDVAKNSIMTFYVLHGPVIPLIWGILAAVIVALTMRRTGANAIDP